MTVIFTQSQQMSDASVVVFEDIVSTWFNAYYNGRRRRQQRKSRRLLVAAGIQNMNSQIEVTDQAVSNVANIVTLTQTLNYDATAEANDTTTAVELVLAPWNDTDYNRDLAGQLAQMLPDAFGSLGAPISPPVIVDPSGTTEDSDSKSEDSSTNPALYSLAALALIPIAGVAYFVYRRKQSKNSEAAASVNNDDEVGPAHPAASARSTRQQREGGRYLPTNKDQAAIRWNQQRA